MNRREFLASIAALPFMASCQRPSPVQFSGQLLGPNMAAGHRLRHADFPAFTRTRHTKVAIVGGGVSGLTAAWQLQRLGMQEVMVFELEAEVGGNARAGHNAFSAYPWGAHYLPIPNQEAHDLKAFLASAGAITANPESAAPTYEERYLCFEPQERLFIHGAWQEGLIPRNGISQREKEEITAFEALMAHYKDTKGNDGKDAFTIPLAHASRDPKLMQLDTISMADFLHQQGWHSEALHWYVNYATRDDYGTSYDRISAWAGIHYFASRRGRAANADPDQVLTWPQGNAWLIEQLAKPLDDRVSTQAVVHQILNERHHACLDVYSLAQNTTTRWLADYVIFASPYHVLPHVLKNQMNDFTTAARRIPHAPWLVANLTLDHTHENADLSDNRGVGLAWDNVLYQSLGLGYIYAQQQSLAQHQPNQVITYYQALAHLTPDQARLTLKNTDWRTWATHIVQDLTQAHPNIANTLQHIDIWRWPHAMTYPYIGFYNASDRQLLNTPIGRLCLAHTDGAGISIFEEAFEQGLKAANQIARQL